MKRSTKKKIIGALVGFSISGVSAAIFSWRAKDLIWGLWGASLGLATIGTFILVVLSIIEERRRKLDVGMGDTLLGILVIGIGMPTILVIFINSFAPQLNVWFPLGEGVSKLHQIIVRVVVLYWPVILSSMIAQFISYPRAGLLAPPLGEPMGDDDDDPFLRTVQKHWSACTHNRHTDCSQQDNGEH